MNWQDDPEIQQQLRERGVRNGIVRTAVIWTPFFLLSLGTFLYFLVDLLTGGNKGTWFLIVVLGLFTTLFGFQSIQALLDLRSKPREVDDVVTRRWTRTDSLVMKSHYVRLGAGQILRGDPVTLAEIREGDRVVARFYPHSAVLVACERIIEPLPETSTPSSEEA